MSAPHELTIFDMMLRLVLAVSMGGLVGIEREKKRRAAGFRTYMLVALGATVTMLLAQYLSIMVQGQWAGLVKTVVPTDVSRLGAQVINGVGFLGAGTIIVTYRQEIQGLTTAAGLWASACMGLAIGAGFYECMIVAIILMLLCMILFSPMENRIRASSRNMSIYAEVEGVDRIGVLTAGIRAEGCRIYDVELCSSADTEGKRLAAVFTVGLTGKQDHMELLGLLSCVDGVVSIQES
jgi:putative Mg2+ transporter-C (MgtC) family protein